MAQVEAFDYLKAGLANRGWTIPQFAKRAGVSIGLAYKWLSEDPAYRVTPSPASCEKIAAALGEDPDYVLELAGHRQPREPRAQINPRLSAFLAQVEAGWLAMEEPERDVAERGTRALFSVPGIRVRDRDDGHATARLRRVRPHLPGPPQDPDNPEHPRKNGIGRAVARTAAAA